jgi:hypothetical protein
MKLQTLDTYCEQVGRRKEGRTKKERKKERKKEKAGDGLENGRQQRLRWGP